ncbi:MAG: hypothetical protein NTW19_17945 [Planctomycetota bacterium]|nr:hypothetical protein [Planctomycetota bacterium]
MRCPRLPLALVLVVGFLTLGPLAAPPAFAADAMPDMPSDVIKSATALNANQQKTLDSFVRSWVDRLTAGEDDQVAEARVRLLDVFQKGGTDIFNLGYSAALSRELAKALGSERVGVRLNAIIVTTKLIDPGAGNLVQTGLKDESPAVRYWAAKALAEMAAKNRLVTSDLPVMLKSVSGALVKEPSPQVVEQLFRVLPVLQVPDAMVRLLQVLNDRVDLEAQTPGAPLRVALQGMQGAFVKLVEEASKTGGKVQPDTMRVLAKVAYRYMTLAAVELNSGRVPLSRQREYEQMIELGDTILKWVIGQMSGKDAPSTDIKPLIFNKQWPDVLLRADQWNKVLVDQPYKLSSQELEVVVVR